jgi:ketosteroid isomerase-like protein
MTRRYWITGLCAAVATAAWRRPVLAQPPNRSLADAVVAAERAFADAMAKRDLDAFAAQLSAEAVFFSSPDGIQVLRGKKAIVDGWRRFFSGPAAPFSWSPATAQVLDSGTLAMTTGPVRNPNGEITGRFSSVWRLDADGKWRVIFDRGCSCGNG